MALKSIGSNRIYKKASLLRIGDVLKGYVIGISNGGKYPDKDNLEMVLTDDCHPLSLRAGEKFTLAVCGNLKFFKKNEYPVGCYYEFKLVGEKDTRGGRSKVFDIQVDEERKMEPIEEAV